MPSSKRRHPPALSAEDKRLFRTACAYFGHTRDTWAVQHNIGTGYLDKVRSGFEHNDRVVGQMRDTISQFRRMVAEDYIAEHPEICRVA